MAMVGYIKPLFVDIMSLEIALLEINANLLMVRRN